MLKQKLAKNLLPFTIAFIGLSLAGLVSFLLIPHSQPKGVAALENTVTKTPPSPTPLKTKLVTKTALDTVPTPVPSPIPTTPTPTIISQPKTDQPPTETPTSTPSPQTNQVNVSIKGSSSFTVSVSDGDNQCDVLTKSLAEGKISSLNMRYDQNYGTYGVYQINGIGKENSVWWTYKVNGQQLPQGCSFIKAKNSDNVEWEYIGS